MNDTLGPRAIGLVDASWSGIFPLPRNSVGPVVTTHQGPLAGYVGIYVVVRHGRLHVSVPDRLALGITRWVQDPRSCDAAWWARRFPRWTLIGPAEHSYTGAVPALPPAPGDLTIKPAARDDLAGVKQRVSPAEWEEGGFDDQFLCAWVLTGPDGDAVAAARLSSFAGMAADVGVVTCAENRGQGLGRMVAAHAVGAAVHEHGLARWRCRTSNQPSRGLAAQLGFYPDAIQWAVRPR